MPSGKIRAVAKQPQYPASPLWDGGKIKFHPVQALWNGDRQHIMWLGVNGWVIVNHVDKELLLVDPWPTYDEVDEPAGRRRLVSTANFLRRAVADGFKLVGLLLSHKHFDHVRDVPRLLTALQKPASRGGYLRAPVPPAGLPVICADYDTVQHLDNLLQNETEVTDATRALYAAGGGKWVQIAGPNGEVLRYGDHYNQSNPPPLQAGIACRPFPLGRFLIQPYVWDHYSIMPFDAGIFGAAGDLQRQSAYLIRHAGDGAKRTFVIGSAGEMCPEYSVSVKKQSPPIETDLLIQSICRPGRHLDALLAYQEQCFKINDAIVCSHWEDFFGAQGGVADRKELKENFYEMVKPYIERVRSQRLKERVYILGRAGFEFAMPSGPAELALEAADLE